MRISDWSSDVCSSDLHFNNLDVSLRRRRITHRQARQSDHRLSEIADQHRLAHVEDENLAAVGHAARLDDKLRDRKSVVQGKSVSVRVDLGGRRSIKKKRQDNHVEANYVIRTRKQHR